MLVWYACALPAKFFLLPALPPSSVATREPRRVRRPEAGGDAQGAGRRLARERAAVVHLARRALPDGLGVRRLRARRRRVHGVRGGRPAARRDPRHDGRGVPGAPRAAHRARPRARRQLHVLLHRRRPHVAGDVDALPQLRLAHPQPRARPWSFAPAFVAFAGCFFLWRLVLNSFGTAHFLYHKGSADADGVPDWLANVTAVVLTAAAGLQWWWGWSIVKTTCAGAAPDECWSRVAHVKLLNGVPVSPPTSFASLHGAARAARDPATSLARPPAPDFTPPGGDARASGPTVLAVDEFDDLDASSRFCSALRAARSDIAACVRAPRRRTRGKSVRRSQDVARSHGRGERLRVARSADEGKIACVMVPHQRTRRIE